MALRHQGENHREARRHVVSMVHAVSYSPDHAVSFPLVHEDQDYLPHPDPRAHLEVQGV